ncbi:hypothetical protein CQW23_27875 [Capsicum baccatum]|uniref:Uncharacterized protein n=1 Tax=Capsicum baccatum TaxID=33114 RepID=A0A2G2VF10_CAPBA|nr:hypothetical protein CQW23_27875 [Capsicum baccatum]
MINNTNNNPIANNSLQLVEAHRNANVCGLNLQLTQILGEVEIEKKRGESLDQMRKTSQSQCWWEAPISQLDLQELEQLKDSMEALKKYVTNQASKFMVGSSSGKQLTGADVVNKSAIFLTKDHMFHERTKHIDVRYHFVREIIARGDIVGLLWKRWRICLEMDLSYELEFVSRSDEDVGPLSPLSVSLAAGFSGSLAASASHGFDTAKSRSQCMILPKRFESWTGIHPADRNILFRGLGLRMARSGIASFVVVGGYLFAIDKLLSE